MVVLCQSSSLTRVLLAKCPILVLFGHNFLYTVYWSWLMGDSGCSEVINHCSTNSSIFSNCYGYLNHTFLYSITNLLGLKFYYIRKYVSLLYYIFEKSWLRDVICLLKKRKNSSIVAHISWGAHAWWYLSKSGSRCVTKPIDYSTNFHTHKTNQTTFVTSTTHSLSLSLSYSEPIISANKIN